MTDWESFNTKLWQQLQHTLHPKPIQTTQEAKIQLTQLNKTIQETIKETVPMTKPSLFAKQ